MSVMVVIKEQKQINEAAQTIINVLRHVGNTKVKLT